MKRFLALASLLFCGWTHSAQPPNSAVVSTSTTPVVGSNWRDQEIVVGWFSHGEAKLRTTGGGGLFFNVGVASPGAVRMGIISSGVEYNTYVQDTPSSCITNWPTTGSHTFTYGVKGFTVYFLIDGVQAVDTCQTTIYNLTGALNYLEYRPSAFNAGAPVIEITTGSTATATFNYFTYSYLYSTQGVFDPRDFGMRAIGAVTGSMSASSTTLTLNSAVDIRVGDQIIVEVGGESGGGLRNTIGVGGTSPVLNYTNATARDADTSQPNGTYAYLQTDGSVWVWSTGSPGSWAAANLGGNYYIGVKNPFALVSKVTAVNANPATILTLATAASVATTNANVYLDSQPSFYPMTTPPATVFANRSDGLDTYSNMTINVPSGTWYVSDVSQAFGPGSNRNGLTLIGQGQTSTIFVTPKGTPSQLFDMNTGNNNVSFHDFRYNGNHGANGYMFAVSGANRNFFNYPGAIIGGTAASNVSVNNVTCYNNWNDCPSLAGTNPTVSNITVVMQSLQNAYLGWQVQLSDCTGGSISNSTVTGTNLIKSFEVFACTGASIHDVVGTNSLFSTNSSSSWHIYNFTDTIQTNAWGNPSSGGIDEAIINVNDNAFGTGNTGAIDGTWSITQQGYIDSSNNSLKFIQIASAQTNVTVTGGFPGGGGCSTTLPGFMSAPNYNGGSAEYGAMAVYSDAVSTVVTGIRIKGTAIGSPGMSGHFGNISLGGASSSATNNVADVIQTGPTQSGNQTNAAYGGC
jgi:hypothetical protein